MPRRSSKSKTSPRAIFLLAALTLLLFMAGEAVILLRTDGGRLMAAKYLRIGDPARVTQLVGKQVRRGLEAAHVPGDSIHETVMEKGPAPVRIRVGLGANASPLQVNYAISRSLAENGGEILSGRERTSSEGATVVTLLAGVGGRPTHEVVLVRNPLEVKAESPRGARLAVVLFGFGEEPDMAKEFFRLPLPFAVALSPATTPSPALFRAARQSKREIVLSLPLEPINYPQVSPGPGTVLVTMKPAQVSSLVRRYLEQADPVAAVANHMGSLATQDMTVMNAVFGEMKRAGVPFLHVSPAPGAVCKSLAADLGLPYDEADAVLDREARKDTPAALERSWREILEQARRRSGTIVLMRATALTRKWLPQALAPKRLGDVSLVPISSVMRTPTSI